MSGSNQSILEDVRRVGERHKLIMRPPLQKPFRIDAIRKVLADAPIDQWPEASVASPTTPSVGSGRGARARLAGGLVSAQARPRRAHVRRAPKA